MRDPIEVVLCRLAPFAVGLAVAAAGCILPSYQAGEGCAAPLDDENPCTVDECVGGEVMHTALPDDEACSAGGSPGACKSGTCVALSCDPRGAPSQCDDGNPCTTDACDMATSQCTWTNLDDVPTPDVQEVAGDCIEHRCVGGVDQKVPDPGDLPPDVVCKDEACDGSDPVFEPSPAGTPCGGGMCDGKGACTGCMNDSDCGTTTECATFTCSGGQCSTGFVQAGTAAGMQLPGDCYQKVCDGSGMVVAQPDDTDAPSDGLECTGDICMNGTPKHPPSMAGTPCAGATGMCNGAGGCVQCLNLSDCPPPSGPCVVAACISGTCSESPLPQYTPCGMGQSCNASGACVLDNGAFCLQPVACASGFCVDSVCCEAPCPATQCLACVQGFTGFPDGACTGVFAGTDPKGVCMEPQTCKPTGPGMWACGN